MTVPRSSALRLESRSRARRAPRPPFGLSGWSDQAPALAIVLDAASCDTADPAAVAAEIPEASSLEPGTLVYVFGVAARAAGLFARWRRPLPVPRAARCTALLARGYADIGAGVDDVSGSDLAWGSSPRGRP